MLAPARQRAHVATIGRRIPFAEYAAIDAVNWSSLKQGIQSLKHYRDALDVERKDTPAMRFGRAVHCACLEPDEFPRRYVIDDGTAADLAPPRNTKAGKEAWAAFCADHPDCGILTPDEWRAAAFADLHPGKELLSDDEYTAALACRDAVRSDPFAAPYLVGLRPEVSIEWTDAETRLRCKARLDGILADGTDVELKTARTIAYGPFASDAWRRGYYHQLAFRRLGLIALGIDVPCQRWIAVESARPFDVGTFAPHPTAMDKADEEVRELLIRLAHAKKTNVWPGQYWEGERDLIPAWMVGDDAGALEARVILESEGE